jgi:predicted MFS family arabinose efflux permease
LDKPGPQLESAAAALSGTLLSLAAAGFVSGASMRVAEPLIPTLAQYFGTSVAAAASVITAFTLAYGLLQIVHGALGDRIGKLRAVTYALLLSFVGSVGCALAPSLSALVALRFATGMTASAVVPLSLALIADGIPYERRQVVLGRFISGILLGQAFGPLIGGVLGDLVGWRASFGVLGMGFLATGAILLPRLGSAALPAARPAAHLLARYGGLVRRVQVRRVLFAVALEGFLFYGVYAFLGALLRERFALSYTAIGLTLAGFGFGGLVYSLLVRALHRWLGETGLVRVGGLLMLACLVGIATIQHWMPVVPLVGLLGLAFYMMHNTLQTRATEMAPDARGPAVSLFALCLFLSQAAGVSVAGAGVHALGYGATFAVAGIGLAALGAWIATHRR